MSVHTPSAHAAPEAHEGHPGPATYAVIALILTVITVAEVGVYYVEDLRALLVPFLIVLSTIKFAIVVMYYMHLKFDHKIFTTFFGAGLFIALSTILALMALFGAFVPPTPPHA